MAAQRATIESVAVGTHEKRNRCFGYYQQYLRIIELEYDPFLTGFTDIQRVRLICAFLDAYRSGRFTPSAGTDPRKASTCRDALDSVVEAYRANGYADPSCDSTGKLNRLLSAQLKGYKNLDPGEQPQKASTPSLIREACKTESNHFDLASSQLIRGAFFFAMRSCEYLTVPGPERKTKRLRLRNLVFRRNNTILPHSDPALTLADNIAITFEYQKNENRNETIIMHHTGDAQLCPVRAWGSLVQRILSYGDTSPNTFVNAYRTIKGTMSYVQSKNILEKLRQAAAFIGVARLGFPPEEIGTHSIRSGAAMAMYLAGVPVYTIMLIGRWSSDAFLRYIRRQVQEFSKGISKKMLLTEEYFSIPDAGPEDPRVSGNFANFSGRGLSNGFATQSRAAQPSFALHY